MDNNSNFEQQFTQNLKASAPVAQPVAASTENNKLPLIIAIVLAIVTLVETIALIISLTTRPTTVTTTSQPETYYGEVPVEGEDYIDEDYTYDDDFNLTAFRATCTAEDGSTYTFDLSNNFTKSGDSSSNGTYSITDSDLISLSNSDKVLYYNGISVADGLTVYTCEQATESTTE